ncbi:MAG: DUF6273 domain-containing protein [Oscillospiraceae bacterium]|jgi:hypothetical protein|nr:DUF6273 domain-containing protein [Oscillospiraceae bacterium]
MKKVISVFMICLLLASTVACGKLASTPTATPTATQTPTLEPVKVGDLVTFGGYMWRILDQRGTDYLIITEECVAIMPFNEPRGETNWENSTLRKWLNEDFYNNFNLEDKSRIVNAIYKEATGHLPTTENGKGLKDYIFLLTTAEAKRLFADDASQAAKFEGESVFWWLSSSGKTREFAALVWDMTGGVHEDGYYAYLDFVGVRPAIWITRGEADSVVTQQTPTAMPPASPDTTTTLDLTGTNVTLTVKGNWTESGEDSYLSDDGKLLTITSTNIGGKLMQPGLDEYCDGMIEAINESPDMQVIERLSDAELVERSVGVELHTSMRRYLLTTNIDGTECAGVFFVIQQNGYLIYASLIPIFGNEQGAITTQYLTDHIVSVGTVD